MNLQQYLQWKGKKRGVERIPTVAPLPHLSTSVLPLLLMAFHTLRLQTTEGKKNTVDN